MVRTPQPSPFSRRTARTRARQILARAAGEPIERLEGRRLLSAVLANGVLTADGTAGNDDLRLDYAQGQIVVHLNGVTQGVFDPAQVRSIVVNGLDGDDTLRVADNIMGVRLNGGNGNDTLLGGQNNDTLDGGAGNDTVDGKNGADLLIGGLGFDAADYRFETANLTLSIDGAANEQGGGAQGDNISLDIERIVGGAGSDRITGSAADNSITGRNGNDTIVGLGGNDSLDGDAGNDSLDGGAGNDVLTGGAGNDTMLGGDGTDSFITNDQQVDTLVGGAGADQAVADPNDVASEIETGIGVKPPPPPAAAPEVAVSLGTTTVADNSTTPINFGTVTTGSAGVTKTFTVKNTGTANLTLGAVHGPAGFSLVEGLSSTLAPGASDTFTVRLDATAAGAKSGELTFSNNDANENPFNFAIAGTVNNPPPAKAPEITVSLGSTNVADNSTTAINFGTVTRGQSAPTKTFTVKNIGQANLTLGAVHGPAGFSLVEGLSTTLAPGGSDTFTVRLDTSVTGAKSGDINFTTNDADENPFNFRVSGTVNNPAPPPTAKYPEVTVTQASNGANIADGATAAIGFGTVTSGQTGPTRTFRVKNDGQATLALGAVHGPAGFKLVAGLPSSLAPGATASFTVQLDTSTTGTKSGQITFATNDPNENPFNFAIMGVVNAPPTTTPPPATTPRVTASVSSTGTLTVIGTKNNDSIVMTNPGTGIVITAGGVTVPGGPFQRVKRIYVDAGDGNDLVYLTDLNVPAELIGGNGNDTLRAGSGNDNVNGSPGADVIEGYVGDDTLHGGAGDDLLIGGPGIDNIYGDDGNDTLQAADGLGDKMVDGGTGTDTIRKDRTDTGTGT